MDRIDLIILVSLIFVIFRGMKTGFLLLVGSTVGLVGGLILGAWLSPKIVAYVNSASSKSILILGIIGFFAVGLSYLGEFLCHLIDKKLHKKPLLNKANSILGAPFEAFSLLLVIWVVAAGVANVQAYQLGYYTRHSYVVNLLDKALPQPPNFFGKLEKIVSPNGFPNVFIGIEPQHTSVPVNTVVSQQIVLKDENSIVKIQSIGCGGYVQGSGVVIGNGMVVTNAHVIAGTRDTKVADTNGTYSATVIGFNPNLDIAVLRVGGLSDSPLKLSNQVVSENTPGVVLGYPGGGPLVVNNAVVLDEVTAQGQNIYGQGSVNRNIYELQADVEPGNSGGALINSNGDVIGIVFAKSVSQPNIGYALVSSGVINTVQSAEQNNTPVSDGQCAE